MRAEVARAAIVFARERLEHPFDASPGPARRLDARPAAERRPPRSPSPRRSPRRPAGRTRTRAAPCRARSRGGQPVSGGKPLRRAARSPTRQRAGARELVRVARREPALMRGGVGGGTAAPPPSSSMPPAARSSSASSSLARERVALGGRLHLDEAAVGRHHDVHVGVGLSSPPGSRGRAAARRRRRRPRPRRPSRGSAFDEPHPVERPVGGDVGAGDRRAAGAAVGLEHVAVEPERPLAERLEVARRRARRGRSAAGSRPCGPSGAAWRRAGCGHPSRRGAASTRRSSSRAPCRAASAGCPPRSWPCRGRASCPATRARSRAAARGSPGRRRAARSSSGRRPSVAAHAATLSSSAT